jgi:hypothetical protein
MRTAAIILAEAFARRTATTHRSMGTAWTPRIKNP